MPPSVCLSKITEKVRKNHLFVIGVDEYVSPKFNNLNNCKKDGEKLIEILTRLYKFETELVYPLFNQDVSRGGFSEQLEKIEEKMDDGDNLVLYYSGHGHYDEDSDTGAWIPAAAEARSHYIENNILNGWLPTKKAHFIVLIIDCCFSGVLLTQINLPARLDESISTVWGITSGGLNEVLDGSVDGHSPFATKLFDILENNTEKKLRISNVATKLHGYATEQNTKWNPRYGVIGGNNQQNGEYAFHLRQDEKTRWLTAKKDGLEELRAFVKTINPDSKYWKKTWAKIEKLHFSNVYLDEKIDINSRAEIKRAIRELEDFVEYYANKIYSDNENFDNAHGYLEFLYEEESILDARHFKKRGYYLNYIARYGKAAKYSREAEFFLLNDRKSIKDNPKSLYGEGMLGTPSYQSEESSKKVSTNEDDELQRILNLALKLLTIIIQSLVAILIVTLLFNLSCDMTQRKIKD